MTKEAPRSRHKAAAEAQRAHDKLCERAKSRQGREGITGLRHKVKDAAEQSLRAGIAAGEVSPIRSRAEIRAEYEAEKALIAAALAQQRAGKNSSHRAGRGLKSVGA